MFFRFSIFFSCVFLFFSSILVGEISFTDEKLIKRVNAHLVIGDYLSACEEARQGVWLYPNSKPLSQVYIRALARAGDEKAMMIQWNRFIQTYPEERNNRDLLENLAWAVIQNGATSSSPVIRVTAMLGAFFSHDSKGVAILNNNLTDGNSFLRAAAIKLASHMHDASLQEKVLNLFRTEKVWKVRLEAIKAVGVLRIAEARPDLISIISNDKNHAEEKAAAIQALVEMSDTIEREQIFRLVRSDRAGIRLLACELVAYFEQYEDLDLLIPLANDPHADVRAAFFQALGRLRSTTIIDKQSIDLANKGVRDPNPLVAITAAWFLTLNDQNKGLKIFESFLRHQNSDIRQLAAGALGTTGKYGLPLTTKAFKESTDSYVKMNLALAMIGQRVDIQSACDCLFIGLSRQKERWAWRNEGHFRVLSPSKVKHDDAIPNYPEAVNQLTRLEVLEILAIVHYPKAQLAIKSFLQERNWEISGLASALLLTEGDEDAVDLVKGLLDDENHKVKVQAALILALWGKGEDSIQLLQEAYSAADRELKEQILEGVGRVGSSSSLQFLSECLQEPYQTLRIIAAAALLECLYH